MVGHVNGQIVDSVVDVVTLNSGGAPAQSAAMLDVVMAEAMGMSMYNAVNRQQSASMVGSAAVTAACAKMLRTPFPSPPAPPFPPPPPPGLQPLPVPPGMTDAEAIAVAGVDASAAIDLLGAEAQGPDVTSAKTVLERLSDQIKAILGGSAPTPTPAPTPAPTPTPTPAPTPTPTPGPSPTPTPTPTTPAAAA